MRDLSLHLLDLAQNSITAGANLVTIRILLEDSGMLTMELIDDGKGMSPELLERVTSPIRHHPDYPEGRPGDSDDERKRGKGRRHLPAGK